MIQTIFLTCALVGIIFFFLREITTHRKTKRTLARVQHEGVCNLLNVSCPLRKIEYHQLQTFWESFKKETPDQNLFVTMAEEAISYQIKSYTTFENAVDHFIGFDDFIKNGKIKPDIIDMIKRIHGGVASHTVSKVSTLAQAKAHRLRIMPKESKEKRELVDRFKIELQLVAFTNYYPFSYESFMQREKDKLSDGKLKKPTGEALVVGLKKVANQ